MMFAACIYAACTSLKLRLTSSSARNHAVHMGMVSWPVAPSVATANCSMTLHTLTFWLRICAPTTDSASGCGDFWGAGLATLLCLAPRARCLACKRVPRVDAAAGSSNCTSNELRRQRLPPPAVPPPSDPPPAVPPPTGPPLLLHHSPPSPIAVENLGNVSVTLYDDFGDGWSGTVLHTDIKRVAAGGGGWVRYPWWSASRGHFDKLAYAVQINRGGVAYYAFMGMSDNDWGVGAGSNANERSACGESRPSPPLVISD